MATHQTTTTKADNANPGGLPETQTEHGHVAAVALVLMDKQDIIKGQDKIKGVLSTLDVDIHNNAVQCMLHAEKHGDTSLMRRLLIDVIDTSTGYRRAGLIAWMRNYSPMELSGDNINLSGKDAEGNKRPFRVAEANANPFRVDDKYKEQLRPFFQDNARSSIANQIKATRAAINNTVNGQPIDKTKPFYDGVDMEAVSKTMDALEAALQQLPADQTKAVRKAQAEAKALGLTVVEGDKKAA